MPGGDVRTVQVRIAGRVQGVGYRYWTKRVAGDPLGPIAVAHTLDAAGDANLNGAHVASGHCDLRQ